MKLKMTIKEALEFSDEWCRGMTLTEGSQGWRVVCMLLAKEVRRQKAAIRQTLDENGHLADGEVCTLKVLKDALAEVEE